MLTTRVTAVQKAKTVGWYSKLAIATGALV